ncbi:MAG: hypothetical protein ACOVLC_02955 [Flavobacterium sp.]
MEKEKLILQVQKYLDKNNMSYDKKSMDSVIYQENGKIRGGLIKPVYFISYELFLKNFIEGVTNVAVLDAKTEELLYIMTPHGYLEIE